MEDTKRQMDVWEIKMVHKMVLWGIITPRIEYLVAKYGTRIDHAKALKTKLEVENEFIAAMRLHGIVCA